MKRLIPIAIVALCCLAIPVKAEGYVGASYLNNSAKFEESGNFSFDADESGWKIFGGYNFMKFVGVEASYRDMGSYAETDTLNSVNADIKSYDISARGILPLGKMVELFAKIGYGNVNADGTISQGLTELSFDESDWELLYGVGVGVNFGKFGVRAEYEAYDVDEDLSSVSLGVLYRF